MSTNEITRAPYLAAFPENLPFWDAAARGELLLPRCAQCNEVHWHPRAHCPFCRSDALRWERASGKARLHTFTILGRSDAAYVLAYVQLHEGPLMLTNVVGVEPSPQALSIGMPLQVEFRQTPQGRSAPVFRPA